MRRAILYDASGTVIAVGPDADGTPSTSNPVIIGGKDLVSDARSMRISTVGHPLVAAPLVVPGDAQMLALDATLTNRTQKVQLTDGVNDHPTFPNIPPVGTERGIIVRPIQDRYVNVYSFTLDDAAGVVAANRFLSLFNPAASGITVVVLGVCVSSYSVAVSASPNSIRLTRVTAASAGTLQGAAAIFKWDNTLPNHVAEVRTANPTVTLAAGFVSWPPNQNVTAASSTAAQQQYLPLASHWRELILNPGHGIVFHTNGGDVDERLNFHVTWAER